MSQRNENSANQYKCSYGFQNIWYLSRISKTSHYDKNKKSYHSIDENVIYIICSSITKHYVSDEISSLFISIFTS